jgi:hypothetical protein
MTTQFDKQSLAEYYENTFSIGELILETFKKHKVDVTHKEPALYSEEVNPFYSRISFNGGVALEYEDGLPHHLHTPLGMMLLTRGTMSSSKAETAVYKELVERLGLVEIEPIRKSCHDYFGPTYAVTKDVKGNPLPMPDLNGPANEISYEESKALWEEVKPMALRRDTASITKSGRKKLLTLDKTN